MPAKHFLFNPYKGGSDKGAIETVREEREKLIKSWDDSIAQKKQSQISEEDNLIHVEGRVIIKVDMDFKNFYQFQNGTRIRLERQYNNFNRRETQPVNVIVISGENIPKGAEMLVGHNALHETNRINNYKNIFENEESDKVRYYSIPVSDCFAWREGIGKWNPIAPFEFALRVFKPYKGALTGIDPEVLKDTLYVTTGELSGNIVKTMVSCDYQIVFQGDDGREKYLIRFRPFGDEKSKMEPEAIAVMDELNKKFNKGELLIGFSKTDAKPISEIVTNN